MKLEMASCICVLADETVVVEVEIQTLSEAEKAAGFSFEEQ